MNDSSIDDIHSIGGSAYNAVSADEITSAAYLYRNFLTSPALEYQNQAEELQEFGSRASNAVRYQLEAFTDPTRSPKYASRMTDAHLIGGALSVQPLFGSLIVGNSDNSETKGTFRADGKNSHMYSASTSTTLGSQYVDTANGYDMNILSSEMPSSFFTPVKTWFFKFFPFLTDGRLLSIAIVEGIIVLLAEYLEDVNNDQSFSEQIEREDLDTIIVNNQEFENMILTGRFNQ